MIASERETVLRLSVAVPVFNGMPFIQETVTSVLGQLGEKDELVVVDNASTDGTRDYLLSLRDRRLRLVLRDETQPVGANWTQAIRETRGNYVKLVCGDDILLPDCLGVQLRMFESTPQAVLVAGQRKVVDEWGKTLLARHGLRGLNDTGPGIAAIRRCMLSGTNLVGEPAAVMFRGETIRSAMPWEDRWPYVLDLATYARIASAGDFTIIREPLAAFRVSRSSWSAQILDQQPLNFRGWSHWMRASHDIPWSWLDSVIAEVNLRVKSLFRRYFFWRVSHRAEHFRSN